MMQIKRIFLLFSLLPIAIHGEFRVFVPNFDSGNVSAGVTIVSSTISVESGPEFSVITPDNTKLYVLNNNSNSISVIDVASNLVIATISLPSNSFPEYLAVTPDGSKIYAPGNFNNLVTVIDTATNTIIKNIEVGSFPLGLVITPDGKKVYVVNTDGGSISVIDVATNSVIKTIDIPNASGVPVVTPDGSKVYVARFQVGMVASISTATDTISKIDINVTDLAGFLAVTPDSSKVYVATPETSTVRVISTSSDTVIDAITVGGSTSNYLVSSFDGTTMYVSTVQSDIFPINIADNTVGDAIPVPEFCIYLAITPDDKFLYVVSSNGNPDESRLSIINTMTKKVDAIMDVEEAPGPVTIGLAPFNAQGKQIRNLFFNQIDVINSIAWTALVDVTISEYKVYRNSALTDLAGTISAQGPLEFLDHNRIPGVTYTYNIVGYNSIGTSVSIANITINPL